MIINLVLTTRAVRLSTGTRIGRTRLIRTLEVLLNIEIAHPFAPSSMHFLFQVKPLRIIYFQNLATQEMSERQGVPIYVVH